MFQIDRTYIEQDDEENLQSDIIFIRSKYKDAPTLPQAKDYDISEDSFDDYIDKRQNNIEWKKWCKKKGSFALAILFCIPPVLINLYDKSTLAFFGSFAISIALVLLFILIYKIICKIKDKHTIQNNMERFIKDLLDWKREHSEDL